MRGEFIQNCMDLRPGSLAAIRGSSGSLTLFSIDWFSKSLLSRVTLWGFTSELFLTDGIKAHTGGWYPLEARSLGLDGRPKPGSSFSSSKSQFWKPVQIALLH